MLSLTALWLCPLGIATRLLLIAITCTGAVAIFMPSLKASSLLLRNDDSWQLASPAAFVEGHISTGSYRSQLLIVVAIKPDKGRTRHAVIWRDSVSPSEFSFLHIRLAMTSAQQLS